MAGYKYGGTEFYVPTAIEQRSKPGPKPRTELPPFNPTLCGSMDGYRQHRIQGQYRCRRCLDAYNVYQTAYRAKRRGGT